MAHLKKLVFDFRETMPIVEALGNKQLKVEHWHDIKTILNIPDFPLEEMQFTLSTLIEFKVADFQEDIINISTTATQENNLRLGLDEIMQTWDKAAFKTAPHTK